MPVFIQTSLALLAFAGNSILCRLALSTDQIDSNSFTIVRLLSGALMLIILLKLQSVSTSHIFIKANKEQWLRAFYLFAYAGAFSYAYLLLNTAAGALILFGSVQFSLLMMQYINGHQASKQELMGLSLALAGFIYWILPDAQRPSLLGSALMAGAGLAWAFYTLAGKNSRQAHVDTTHNFILSLPFLLLLLPGYWLWSPFSISTNGFILAMASGAITSAIGYWIWYRVLPSLSTLSAGVLQLTVPLLAALGGIIWAQEPISLSFIVASLTILAGILLVLLAKQKTL